MVSIANGAVASALLLLICFIASVSGFISNDSPSHVVRSNGQRTPTLISSLKMTEQQSFEISVALPGKNEDLIAQMKFKPVLDVPSEIVEIRYKVPFGLNVEPKNNFAICTKNGAAGEMVGDVLRYTSQWTLGLPKGDGMVSTAMSFSGGVSWQVSMFDVMRARQWQEVVDALVSNTESRTDEVVLLFERPLPE